MIVALRKLLLVSPDRVASNMAGPGVRYVELGRVLRRFHDVRLAAPLGSAPVDDDLPLALYDPARPGTLRRLLAPAEVIVAPPLPPAAVRDVAGGGRKWIVDLYNAEPFEGLAHRASGRVHDGLRGLARIDRLTFAARCGSAFVCAGERQRDMWLGLLAANRRLRTADYHDDPALRRLIDVVPFGVPSRPPERVGSGLRGSVFPRDARIIVWNGGVWDWLDPDTVLAALVLLREQDTAWHLAFSGLGRPSHREQMAAARRVPELVRRLGLAGAVHVREWTPYAERAAALLDADVGVSAHRASLEARFAHRARILDLVWTGTPILCTAGDEWSEIVADEGLGEAVPAGDPEALAEAAAGIAARGRGFFAPALAAAASSRSWEAVAGPLVQLVETVAALPPRRPDLVGRSVALRHSAASAGQRWLRLRRPLLARE